VTPFFATSKKSVIISFHGACERIGIKARRILLKMMDSDEDYIIAAMKTGMNKQNKEAN